MSDISRSNSRNSTKRRIHEIDDTIEYLTHEVKKLNDFVFKAEFECSLMTAKLKREKVKALSAVAKSQVILADMEILIAESDLFSDLEKLKNSKKMKLFREEENTNNFSRNTSVSSTKSSQALPDKRKKNKASSVKKSPSVDISSDETVLIATLSENITSVVEASTSSVTDLLKKPATSDSEVSLTSSIKAEFDNPYTPTVAENKSHSKKSHHKSVKNAKSKSKSTLQTQRQSPSLTTKTVAEINKGAFTSVSNPPTNSARIVSTPTSRGSNERKMVAVTSTHVPIRHNLPLIATQANLPVPGPSTSMMNPCLYINNPVSQPHVYQTPRSNMNTQTFHFYGSKQ